MYKIGELSKLCSVPVKTLRYYDEMGLLEPDEVDDFTGYRYYSASKVYECYRIIALKQLGFSLEQIKKQLSCDSDAEILQSLSNKQEELKVSIADVQKKLRQIELVKAELEQSQTKKYDIVIRKSENVNVAFVRNKYARKETAFLDAKAVLNALPKVNRGKRKIIINHETEYKENDFDLSACAEYTGILDRGFEYETTTLNFGTSCACLVCEANELENAYKAMIKYLKETGYRTKDVFYEMYLDENMVELKVPVCDEIKRYDNINYPFVNDEKVIGLWNVVDFVLEKEDFNPNVQNWNKQDLFSKQIEFRHGGEFFSTTLHGTNLVTSTWTKGLILNKRSKTASKYEIKIIDGKEYLFREWKSGDYIYHGKIHWYIYTR